MEDINAVIDKKLEGDTEFHNTLVDLSDEDKNIKVSEKRQELIKEEFSRISNEKTENEKKFNDQRIRAEKAEAKIKEKDGIVSEPKMSLPDIMAINKANVHEDDIEKVEKFAKSEGITIKEALKNEELKAILDLRQEKRNTADASNVNNSRRQAVKVDDETLISNANNGKLPEDDGDIERLISAKSNKKRNR